MAIVANNHRKNECVIVSNTSLVVQHNKIVEAKYKLSIGEQRLVKLLISMIEKNDEDFKVYRVYVADFSRLLGITDNDIYRKVKVYSKKLISNILIFKGLDDRELQVAWLSSAEYIPSEGVVELEFSPKLKPFLLQLKQHFTTYELWNVINLKHTYSIRIYELLKQYEKIGRRSFAIEHLRELLMLEEGEYKQFCDFRRWILKPAQKELNEKTDIDFVWHEERRNQKCFAIEFVITAKSNPQKLSENSAPIKPIENQEKKPEKSIVDAMVELGVLRSKAEELAEEFNESNVEEKLAYALAKQKEGKVKNLAGFFIKSLKSGYSDNPTEDKSKQEAKAMGDQERKKVVEARRAETEKSERNQVEMELSDKWFESLPDLEKKAIEDDFIEASNTVDIGAFKRKGYNYTGFRFFVKRKWLNRL